MINQHIRQHLEEFHEEETIEFNRQDWDNALISTEIAKEVKSRITNLKKKKAQSASKINAQLLQYATPNIIQQSPTYTMHVYPQGTSQKHSRKLLWC